MRPRGLTNKTVSKAKIGSTYVHTATALETIGSPDTIEIPPVSGYSGTFVMLLVLWES
jgi:hypothetical protein